MRPRVKPEISWMAKTRYEMEHKEELLMYRRVLLALIRWAKDLVRM